MRLFVSVVPLSLFTLHLRGSFARKERDFILENAANAEKSKMDMDFKVDFWHNHFRKLRKCGKI
jgi:hypothetical protein